MNAANTNITQCLTNNKSCGIYIGAGMLSHEEVTNFVLIAVGALIEMAQSRAQ
jgi:hypothetical protein